MASNYGYMAKIGADTSGLQSALKDINSSLKSTDSELYNVQKSIKTAEKAGTDRSDLLKQKEDVLGNAISETAEKLEKLRSIEEQMKNAADNNSISAGQYRDYQRELANTEAQLRQYQTQLVQTQNEQAGMAGSNQLVVTGLRDVQSAAQNVVNDIKFFTDALAGAAQKAVSFSENAVKAALDVGSSFESAMSKVQAYSGASGEAFVKLENAAKDAGANTSKSASEAADALGYMALAGWDTEEMLDGLMPVLRASEAGGADLARTSDLVTDSMSAMGVATSDLTHYLDVCTAAQSNSNTTLTGLLEAYVGCGGTLRNLNVPLEESAALLGTLANRGIKASEAGTSLNSILVNLIGANKSASDAMDALGVSAWDEEGNFIGLSETLKVLKGALEDCTDEQKAFFEAKIGGKTQMDTLQALISGVGDEYDDLYDTLLNANGALEATSKTMQDNLAGAVTTMKSALETLGIEFYDYLEEPAKDAVNAVTEAIRELTESVDKGKLGDSLKNLSEKIADLIEKFAEFASDRGIDLVIDGLSDLIDLLSWMIDNLDTVTALVKGMGAAFLTLKFGQLAIDTAALVGTISSLAAAAEAGSVAAAALGTALNAIPLVAVGALAIGAATAFTSYMDSVMDAKVHLEDLHTETDDFIERLTEEQSKIEDVNKEIDENCDKIDKNCDKAKDLWEQLQDLCDEEGNVNGAYEEAQSLIDQLNVLTDSHITLIGDQIQGYDDLCTSMDNYIERMRISAKLEYMHEDYVKAIGKRDELQADIDTAKQAESAAHNKRVDFETQRGQGKINKVSDFTDVYQLANSPEWKDFAEWYNGLYKYYPDVFELDDYAKFLAYQEQLAKNEVHSAEAAYNANEQTITRYETESVNLTQTDNKTSSSTDDHTSGSGYEDNDDPKLTSKEDIKKRVLKKLETLDGQKEVRKIDEDTYWEEVRKLVTNENYQDLFRDDADSKFWDYLDKYESHTGKQSGGGGGKPGGSSGSGSKSGGSSGSGSDDPERTASSAISSKKIELESKKANNDNYTDADYYNDLEAWAETEVDHSTEAYTKLKTEIANGRKALLKKAKEEEQREAEKNAKEKVTGIKSKAEEANGYDTSSLEYWEDFEKRFNSAEWTDLEKGTDAYINTQSEIETGKKKAKYKADLAAAKKAVDDLVTKYENGDEEISTAEILKEKVDAVVSEWKDKNIDISEYANEKLAKAKDPDTIQKNISAKREETEKQAKREGKDSEWVNKIVEEYITDEGYENTDAGIKELGSIEDDRYEQAQKAIDELVKKYEDGDAEVGTLDVLQEKVDAKVAEWKERNIDIEEYAKNAIANAKAPKKSAREKQYDSEMADIDRRAALNEEGYRTEAEIRAKKAEKQEEYRDISGTSTEWWKNQRDIAEGEFDDLYQQYSDGLIDYETFIDRYIELKEKWAKDNIDISEDARSELEKSGKKELSDLKERFDNEEISYEEYLKGVQNITDKYGTAGITLDPSDDEDSVLSAETEKGKKELDDLKKLYKSGEKSYEEYLAGISEIKSRYGGEGITLDTSEYEADAEADETKKGTDAFDDIAENYQSGLITYEEFQRQKLALTDEYAKKGIDITQYAADKEKEIFQKELDDINAVIDERAADIAKGALGGNLYEEKDISGGGKKKIFTDLNKKAKDIRKYTEDLKKLQQTNIPQELMDEILAMNFEDRAEVIRELLRMSENKRNLYYTDYTNYQAAAKEAASAEHADEKEEIENKIADSADSALESTVDTAGDYGKSAAKAYVDGWNSIIQNTALSWLFPKAPPPVPASGDGTQTGTDGSSQTAGGSTGNPTGNGNAGANGSGDTYISAKQPISINIAGIPVITATVGEMLRASGLIGRANSKF